MKGTKMMHGRAIFFLLTAVSSLSSLSSLSLSEAEAVTLELKAKSGEVKRYTLKTVAEQKPSVGDTLQGASMTTTFSSTVRLSVAAAPPAGPFIVEGQFQKLDLQMKMGDHILEAGDLPMIADLKEQLVKQAITFTVTKKGEVTSVASPPVDHAKILEGATMFGDAGAQVKRTLESFLQHAYSWLPEGDVKVGETWKRSIQSGVVTDPPLTFNMIHRLESLEKMKGQECAKITTVIEVPETQIAEGAYQFSGSGVVTTYFGLKTGATLSSKSVLQVRFSGSDQPAALESVVTTTIEAQ